MELSHKITETHSISIKSAPKACCRNRTPQLVGNSPAIQKLKQTINRIAPSDMTVLITGESGTGKEEVARMVHQQSKRRALAFMAINCAALPAELVESELFGHERGAFSGAFARQIGRLEAADGGTLLLDEIGEMPLALQAKLLRFLQEREVQRIGSNRTIKVNIRIIAATNRVLTDEIKAGRFRDDFYYRLQICQITVPPLREHSEDIRLLVLHFAETFAAAHKALSFTDGALATLEHHEWRGNVRELANAVEFAVHVCSGGVVTVDDLPENLRRCGAGEGKCDEKQQQNGHPHTTRLHISPLARHEQWHPSVNRIRAERSAMERQMISAMARQMIDECGGNKTLAAKEMGISRQRLYEVLKEGED